MRVSLRILFSLFFVLLAISFTRYATAEDSPLSPEAAKKLVREAVVYALETRDPKMDYGKFVSPNFINHVDSNTFNFDQWVNHQKHIKALVKSMQPKFISMVAEAN